MYFPFFEPQSGSKRSAVQPQTIYSEFPERIVHFYSLSSIAHSTGVIKSFYPMNAVVLLINQIETGRLRRRIPADLPSALSMESHCNFGAPGGHRPPLVERIL